MDKELILSEAETQRIKRMHIADKLTKEELELRVEGVLETMDDFYAGICLNDILHGSFTIQYNAEKFLYDLFELVGELKDFNQSDMIALMIKKGLC